MSHSDTYQVRWRGRTTGPFPLTALEAMLSRNEISLMHEVFADGRWVSLEELLLATGRNQTSYEPESAPERPAALPPTMAPEAAQPPPIPPEEMFHVAKGGRQEGPFTKSALRQLAVAGVVSSEDLAWREGMPEWMPLGRLMADLPRPTAAPPFTQTPGFPPSPTRQPIEQPLKNTTDAGAHGVVVGGYVCSFLALLFFPPFLALAGFVCGIVALVKGTVGHGIAIILLSLICGLLGMAIGEAVFPD